MINKNRKRSIAYQVNLKSNHLPEARELLSLLQDSNKHFFHSEFQNLRNPDAIYLRIGKDGEIIIEGIGEMKLGHLNERALSQLELFPHTVSKLCKVLNEPEYKNPNRLRSMGLEALASRVWSLPKESIILRMSPKFRQFLVVPRNRDIEKKPFETERQYIRRVFYELVDNRIHHLPEVQDKFLRVFTNTTILKSVFSTADVSAICDYLFDNIFYPELNA